jgi:hypothetical protein
MTGHSGCAIDIKPTGAFKNTGLYSHVQGMGAGDIYNVGFEPSLVVPTYNENSSRTISRRFWRRVA